MLPVGLALSMGDPRARRVGGCCGQGLCLTWVSLRGLNDFDHGLGPGVFRIEWPYALSCASRTLDRIIGAVSAGTWQADTDAIVAQHRIVMNFESSQAHGHLLGDHRSDLLQPKFRAALMAGAALSPVTVTAARAGLIQAARTFWAAYADTDLIVTLPVPEGAPLIDGTTGFQDWLTPWTVFGGPLVCLPWGVDTLGRPLSVMLAAHPGRDAQLLAVAAALEPHAPPIPAPIPPVG